MILLTVKDKNYSRNICIIFCRPKQTRKHFQDVPSWYLLPDLAALNENITFQLRSFSLEDDSQDFHIEGQKLPGICVYSEIKSTPCSRTNLEIKTVM